MKLFGAAGQGAPAVRLCGSSQIIIDKHKTLEQSGAPGDIENDLAVPSGAPD
jgi:hypothetical protein